MWGGFLGKRRHCLPLITWVKETLCAPAGLRVQGTDRPTVRAGEQAGAGSQALTLLWAGAAGGLWGQLGGRGPGPFNFPRKGLRASHPKLLAPRQ